MKRLTIVQAWNFRTDFLFEQIKHFAFGNTYRSVGNACLKGKQG